MAEGLQDRPADWHRGIDALVLASPALDAGLSALQSALVAVLGRIAPDLALGNGLDPAGVSRDPAVVRAYIDDPLVHDRLTRGSCASSSMPGNWCVRWRRAGGCRRC